MGIPLRLIKKPSPRSFKLEARFSDIDIYENYEPYFLLMKTDVADEEKWATANLRLWDIGPVGSVLVVLADGKALLHIRLRVWRSTAVKFLSLA